MSRRPSFTREERRARGLPVCAIDRCDRAPHRVGLCWAHYEDPAARQAVPWKRRPSGTPTATTTWDLRPDLVLALSLEAARRGVTRVAILEEVLAPVAATWGLKPRCRCPPSYNGREDTSPNHVETCPCYVA